jgi:glycosyltransferase involved in cell wall biosynthesis
MGRLRVLHVGKYYPPARGGMESHLATLCERLAEEVDVRVVVSSHAGPRVRETLAGVEVTRVRTVLRTLGAAVNPGMAAEIRAARPDVVHLHHPNPTAFLSYLASGCRAPLVVTYHSDIVRHRWLAPLVAPVLHRVLSRAAAIVASSPGYALGSPVLRRHAARVRVIPFGVGDEAFAAPPAGDVARLRQRWGERVVLGVGRLVYYKGFEYLVRAMERVPGTLVLVGDGPRAGRLRRIAAEAGVAGRVVFAGAVPDPRAHYAAADVFALPSVARSEAFGIVQLEAMAAGLPVVNTRIDTGVPFVSRDGETGITVPPRDVPALASALSRLLDDPPLRRSLGDAARRRVSERFAAGRMVAETLALYRAVATKNPPIRTEWPHET